jgi:CRISPR-associated protein Csb1
MNEDRYDSWLLEEAGAAALVLREHLMSAEGRDGVLFPATFAASEDRTFKGGYNVDELADGHNVCLVDSIGSQANRIEPIFAEKRYQGLVPQIVIEAGARKVNLLHAPHRAGDALVRCSSLQKELQDAFKAVESGDAEPLAKVAPTSLVFGVWDSRDTQAKLPRVVRSTIQAFDVRRLTRSAQYIPAVEYVEENLLEEAADKKAADRYAERGFVHVPASGTHGGVIATGGIRRDAMLQLAALRMISTKAPERALPLRRYLFGLALTAFTAPPKPYLRQGCTLVLDPDRPIELVEVHGNGERKPLAVEHEDALAYAKVTAAAFGVGQDRVVPFDKERARKEVSGEDKAREKKAGKKSEAKKN